VILETSTIEPTMLKHWTVFWYLLMLSLTDQMEYKSGLSTVQINRGNFSDIYVHSWITHRAGVHTKNYPEDRKNKNSAITKGGLFYKRRKRVMIHVNEEKLKKIDFFQELYKSNKLGDKVILICEQSTGWLLISTWKKAMDAVVLHRLWVFSWG
jgi:hypothetical protein